MDGWIKLYRSVTDSTVWVNPVVFMVWCWCLMKANHVPHKFPFNGQDIEILPGQFITGRTKALKELPISAQNYRTAISYLKSTNRITIKSTNRFTLISVIKWHEYQTQSTSKLTNHQPTTNQPLTTYKKEKNEKNIYTAPKIWKDGDTIPLKDCTAIRRFGEWVDIETHTKLDRNYYTQLP